MNKILDDCREIKMKPYLYLKNNELSHVINALNEKSVFFEIKKIYYPTYGTGIIPMNSSQLNAIDNIIYIPEHHKNSVDKILDDYTPKSKNQNIKALTHESSKLKTKWSLLIATSLLFISILYNPIQTFIPTHADWFWKSYFYICCMFC